MDMNDRFSRQQGEDSSAHFARLARDLWVCVDETKRKVEQLRSDRDRDLAVRAERDAARVLERERDERRLERIEDRLDALRIAAGVPGAKSSIFDVDLKTVVIVGIAVGAVVYEIVRRSTL